MYEGKVCFGGGGGEKRKSRDIFWARKKKLERNQRRSQLIFLSQEGRCKVYLDYGRDLDRARTFWEKKRRRAAGAREQRRNSR